MRWPWQRPIVEHRSSYTDAVVTAILQSASGGGLRTALATAALESCASMYSSALAACEVSGPSVVTRALTADWRASVASGLVRHGQALYLIDADPSSGLALVPVSHWDVHGGPDVASWFYRCELAGPSSTAWRTRSAGGCLHLRWLIDNERPWAGVSRYSTRPIPAVSRAGSTSDSPKRRAGRLGSFLPVARYDADPDADLADADPDADPLAALRRDIGGARGQTLIVETAMASADSPASAPRKDYQVAQIRRESSTRSCGAASERHTRHRVRVRHPARVTRQHGIGQASREAWRQFISTSVDGLCRRLEAQLLDQLGVDVKIDTSPLGGRDFGARCGFSAAQGGRSDH